MTEEEINEAARLQTWLIYTGSAFRWRDVIVIPHGEGTRATPHKQARGAPLRTGMPMRISVMDSLGHMDNMPIDELRVATADELETAGIDPKTHVMPTPHHFNMTKTCCERYR